MPTSFAVAEGMEVRLRCAWLALGAPPSQGTLVQSLNDPAAIAPPGPTVLVRAGRPRL